MEFTYTSDDGTHTVGRVVKVNVVGPVNNPPRCHPVFYNGERGHHDPFPVEDGDVADVTLYCMDDEAAVLTFTVLDGPDHGTVSRLVYGGSQYAMYTYTPVAGYRGSDEFTLRANDGTHIVDTVFRVDVIEAVNDPPECGDVRLVGPVGPDGRPAVEAGEPNRGFHDCRDEDDHTLVFSVPDGPDHGTVSGIRPEVFGGDFTYTPDAGYRGPDQFTLRASDGVNNVDIVVEANVVDPVNDPHTCEGPHLFGRPYGPGGRQLIEAGKPRMGFMDCEDEELAHFTYSVLDPPDHGTVGGFVPIPQVEGVYFTYTPDADYRGPDDFTLRASDGTHNVDLTSRVEVVEPTPDEPHEAEASGADRLQGSAPPRTTRQTAPRRCAKLKPRRRRVCAARARAVSRCRAIKVKSKKKVCYRNARKIGRTHRR